MELLHDSNELVGNLDNKIKHLEKKIDMSLPVEIAKDIRRLDNEIRFIKDRDTSASAAFKYNELTSKLNDVNRRIDNLEKKIDSAVRELKSEARKTSVLRKLLWLD